MAARMMRQYMDPSVDPCTDFYTYACGGWTRSHPIPPDKTVFDTFEMLREMLDAALRVELERPTAPSTTPPTNPPPPAPSIEGTGGAPAQPRMSGLVSRSFQIIIRVVWSESLLLRLAQCSIKQ